MIDDNDKSQKQFQVSVSGMLTPSGESDSVIVANIYLHGKEPRTLVYPETTESAVIAQDSTALSDIQLQPEYLKVITEEIDRSKGWGEGIKFSINIPKIGVNLEFEKKHSRETKTIREAIFRRPQNK